MLLADAEIVPLVQYGAMGLLSGVLFGLARLVWWLLPKALESHVASLTHLATSNKESVEAIAEAHKEAVLTLTTENRQERLRQEERCDREHAKRDASQAQLAANVAKLADVIESRMPPK